MINKKQIKNILVEHAKENPRFAESMKFIGKFIIVISISMFLLGLWIGTLIK